MIQTCTLLLNSYDGGEDCWDHFFIAIKKQWPEMDLPIVLNTESKKYSGDVFDNVKTFSLYDRGQKVPWGRRLIETLDRIDTDYVLFFLEDNWLNKPVNNDLFNKALIYMDNNQDIASIEFVKKNNPEYPNIQDGRFDEFELRPNKCPYKLNAQVALWRRKDLISFTRKHETPWEWEVYGSERIERFPQKIYVLKPDFEEPFSYAVSFDNGIECDGMINMGRWNKDMVKLYSQIYDLSDIDFSVRGFEDWETKMGGNKSFIERLMMPHLCKRIVDRFIINKYRRWLSIR